MQWTSRFDVSDEDQIAGTDRRRLISPAQESTAMFIDSVPRSFDGPLADHAMDPVALLMDRIAPPLVEHRVAIERLSETLVKMFDEGLGSHLNSSKIAGELRDCRGVGPRVILDRFDVDAGPD